MCKYFVETDRKISISAKGEGKYLGTTSNTGNKKFPVQ